MFKWIAIASLVISLGLGIGTADALTPAKAEQLVRWTGCKADLTLDKTEPVMGSYFRHYSLDYDKDAPKSELYLGIKPYEGLTEEMEIAVLFHESGHCLQYQNSQMSILRQNGTRTMELDADRYSADLMCSYHMDGRQILHDLFVWALKTFDYNGDWGHGTLWERISQGNLATSCNLVSQQSPFMESK